jgi:hypothetical protein
LAIDNGEIPCYEPEDAVPKDVRSLGYETTDEVHRDDLNKWISENCRLLDYRFPNPSSAPVVTAGAPGGVEPAKVGPAKPLQRTAAQDSAILCEIEKQGYDPLALPKNPSGKSGVKADIRAALSQNPLFTGTRVFDKAWERLTTHKDIAIQG